MGRISPVQADAYFQNPYANTYGPFLPRPSRTFTDGAFAPFSPIQPVPVDEPPPGGQFADPRWWQYRVGWNLPTQPGTEGLKLASFDQLYTLANRYSVARACIELRKEEIRGLEWEITLTTDAAKAYQGDRKAMRDFGERKAEVTKFFKHPDPDYWSFSSFLDALLEEIFVYDALSVIFRPKYGASFGMGGRGLLGSDLDSINLVSGPCYSDDTEVLTRRGWLRFADTTAEDEFATRNPKTKTLEWQQATYFHREAWNGRLINFRSRWLDILVTPNHRMLSTSCPRGVKGERHGDEWIIPAGILAEKGSKFQLIPHTSINDSPDLASFRLPVSLQAPFGEMTGDDFAAFMGMWLAEGCVTWHGERGKRKRPTVYVTQDEKSRGFRPYRELLNRLFGRDVAYNGHSFYFRHAGLAGYLKQFGHAHEKFLPDEILGLSARQAEIFWHYYWLGDGYADRQRICTSSSRMADGLQILAQRMGKWATVSTEYAHGAKQLPGGRSIDQDHIRPKYLIALHSHSASTWNAEYTDYDGFVYCVSLPNETMYVRRNGKPAWCCNTIRPLLDMHGGRPRPPAPAYQQYLYGVPRSDYMTIAMGNDIDAYGLSGAEVNEFRSDVMLYAPLVSRRETPYGFPPVERALLPIISGLQKQEFQLDYFTEGTIPAVYISPGDTNITPTQIGELQNALNALAGDPAYHLKVVVLPPGSKVEPQRPVDLSDSFDYLVMNQVAMQFDVQPQELGIIPDIGSNATGPSASAVRFAGQEGRDLKSRKSTKPLLSFICDIFNYAIQDICRQPDMQFTFEGLVDDEDKQVIVDQGVQMIQNGLASIDEVREQLDKPPWGLQETSEPVVFTAQGPVPFSMAPQLIMMAAQGKTNAPGQGTNSGQNSKTRPSQPAVRAGGQTKPNGSHPAPVSPHREAPATPGHAAAAGAVQSPTPRTGGTTSRNSVAGSRKKAALSELESLKRHLRKGRSITTWEPVNITNGTLSMIAEDVAKGVLLDVAVERAASIAEDIIPAFYKSEIYPDEGIVNCFIPLDDAVKAERQFPGWEQDLGLVGRYREEISQAFRDAEIKGSQIRKDAATGKMWVSAGTLHGLISDATIGVFGDVMVPMWRKAWNLGYEAGNQLLGKSPGQHDDQVQMFIDTEGAHWLDQVSRTGLGNSNARSEIIARTEIARAMNAGAIQAYKEAGVSYKHLGVAPDERECEVCKDAEGDGIIPLDAPFSSGGLSGPLHPNCRCVPLPAGIDAEPPQAHIGKRFMTVDEARQLFRDSLKNNDPEDESRVAWLLIRAPDKDGKWRYLLQQRDNGTWGMPGGTTHVGEDGFTAAFRETTEEIGDLPPLEFVRNFNHTDPDGKQAYLFLCEANSIFTPQMNGSTPHETAGTGWFRRKEIGDLDLTDKFRGDWEDEVHLEQALKMISPSLSGEILVDPAQNAQGGGARWPYPHRADGTEDPLHWDDAGPGAVPDEHGSAGGEPPHDDNFADRVNARGAPEGGRDGEFPRRRTRNKPASRFPSPETDGKYPQGGIGSAQPPGTSVPGNIKQGAPHPIVGSIPAKTPKPYNPRSVPPETFDTSDVVQEEGPDGNNVIAGKSDADLADPRKPGGPSDYDDPNETDPEHILSQLRSNFPEKSIQWAKNARWVGPVEIPWERVDADSIDSWAASHQPSAVNRFAADIKANRGHTNPSIMVQRPGKDKAFIVDGHHRALARRKLGKPVLAYVGFIQGKDVQAAEETHSSQFHSGTDPENR